MNFSQSKELVDLQNENYFDYFIQIIVKQHTNFNEMETSFIG